MLSAGERRARASIAVKTRYGIDTGPDRRAFAELQATREFHEAAAKLVEARRAQGFSDKVEDATVLARIANLLIEDAVAAGRLPPAASPESLARVANAIRSVTASPTKNETAPAPPPGAIKEAVISGTSTDNSSIGL